MSSTENRPNSSSEGLQIPGLVQSQEPVEQLSFTPNPMTPASPSPYVTRQLEPRSTPGLADIDTAHQPISQAGVANPATPSPAGSTRALLLDAQPQVTQALENMRAASNTTSLRQPVVIRGSGKRSHSVRPPQGRRHVISIAVLVMLVMVTGWTLLVASPLGQEAGLHFNPFSAAGNLINNKGGNNLSLIAQATATAVVHQQNDGVDPSTGGGGPTLGNTNGSLSWPYGVCTYWANLHYHQLTGVWVSWHGNAYQWAEGARLAGWHVSSTPHVPSIIVLQPGVQGASGAGHVAVVESASGNTAHTSNMNWYTNGGGYGRVSYYDFTAGPGVSFIWK